MLSAVVLAPAALACLWLGGIAWTILIGLAALGAALEWLALCRLRMAGTAGLALLAGIAAALLAVVSRQGGWALLALALAAALVWTVTQRGIAACGVGAVGLGAVALIWLRADAQAGRDNVLFVVLTVWASDIGAYLVGRLAGGPKLAPRISPGKTWSGAVGGLAAAVLAGWLAAGAPASLWPPLVAGALALVSQTGDLFESAVKRQAGVKDSGWLIPGHGGLLDRLDGILAAAPVAALLALVLGRGEYLWR